MRVYLFLSLGVLGVLPSWGLKLGETPQTLNPKPLDAADGANEGFITQEEELVVLQQQDEQQQQQQVDGEGELTEKQMWAAAEEAQLLANAAAAAATAADAADAAEEAAENNDEDAAQKFAAVATAAAEEAVSLAAAADEQQQLDSTSAAAAEEEGTALQLQQQQLDPQQQQQQQEQQMPKKIFAPRSIRFAHPSSGKAITIYFHNAYEPFEGLSCSSLSSTPDICRQHPRCFYNEGLEGLDEGLGFSSLGKKCLLSPGYLNLASTTLCYRTADLPQTLNPSPVSIRELQAVTEDLFEEFAVNPKPFLDAFDPNQPDSRSSLCSLVKELATELLMTERNIQPLPEDAEVQTLNPDEGLGGEVLQSSLGFINGGNPLQNIPFSRLVNPQPHSQLSKQDTKAPAGNSIHIPDKSNAKVRIGINGFGRIGRLVCRIAMQRPDMVISHINTSMSADYIGYMLKYDSVHGRFPVDIKTTNEGLLINNNFISLSSSRHPSSINWAQSNTEYICESTGAFCSLKDASQHVNRPGGARRVVISAPTKDEETPTIVIGVNEGAYTPEMQVVSCASCTTNALAPLIKVIDDNYKLEEGLMTTVHAVTGSQKVVDSSSSSSSKDWRGGRAAYNNIIPASTGAAKAISRCLPHLQGKITGISIRIPSIDISIIDITCRLSKETTYNDISNTLHAAALRGPLRGIIGYTNQYIVSNDIIGTSCSSLFDHKGGLMLNKHFVKLLAWYDNEYAYASRLIDLITLMAEKDGHIQEGTSSNRQPVILD